MITKQQKQRFIDELRKTPVIQVVCQKLSIGRTTYYRLRKEDNEFAKQADLAIEEGRLVVNDLGEAQTIALMKDKDMQAIRFWMTHNDPRYSNKLEIKGRITHVSEELSPEQEQILRQALLMALPKESYEQSETSHDSRSDDQGS